MICTKFGPVFDEASRVVTGADTSPASIRRSCEDSLLRLRTDYLDLLLFHNNHHPVAEAGDVRETLEALAAEGKIRSYGWSTDFADRAEFFARGGRCAAIELRLNLLTDNAEVVAICERENLAAINRGPLAMGLCRGMSLLLGAAAVAPLTADAMAWIGSGMASVTLYVAALTQLARGETGIPGRARLIGTLIGLLPMLQAALALAALRRSGPWVAVGLVVCTVLSARLRRRFAAS